MAKRIWARPGHREKLAKIRKETWNRPGYRERVSKTLQNTPRPKQSEYMKERWQDPEFKEKMAKTMQSSEYHNKISKAMMGIKRTPEHREKMAKMSKARWANLEYRENMSKTRKEWWANPERRAQTSKNNKEWWANPENRGSMSGENSSQWKGGLSFEPYSPDFTKYLRMRIRERDGCKCVLCGSTGKLDVHHINYDKSDSDPSNLITLCGSCHIRTNHNRSLWESGLSLLMRPYL